jgi:hypothetical protein
LRAKTFWDGSRNFDKALTSFQGFDFGGETMWLFVCLPNGGQYFTR